MLIDWAVVAAIFASVLGGAKIVSPLLAMHRRLDVIEFRLNNIERLLERRGSDDVS